MLVALTCVGAIALILVLLFLDEARQILTQNRRKFVAGVVALLMGLSGAALAAVEVVSQDLRIMGRLFAVRQLVQVPQSDTCADDAAGTAPACTLQPTSSTVLYTCADTHTCSLTLAEASDVYAGQELTIIVVGSNNVTIADSSGVQELVASISLAPTNVIGFRYNGSAWVETFRTSKTRSIPLPLTGWVPCDNGIWTASGADALPDFAVVNSALAIQYDVTGGSVDTTEICTAFTVPADYVSGGSFLARVIQGAATVTQVETFSCRISVDGAAIGAANAANLSNVATVQSATSTPAGTWAVGASIAVACKQGNASADDLLNILSIEARYVAGG